MHRVLFILLFLFHFTSSRAQSEHLPFSTPELQYKIDPDEEENEDVETMFPAVMPEKRVEGGLVRYYRNGQLVYQEKLKSGKKVGASTSFYESGAVKQVVPYVNDVIHGLKKYYYKSGGLRVTTPYVKGKREGNRTIYLEHHSEDSEKVYAIIPYKNGQIHGIIKRYDMGRNGYYLRYEATFKNGKANGKWTTYTKDLRPGTTKENEELYVLDTYKIEEEYFTEGRKDGRNIQYHFDGTVMSVTFYKMGVQQHQEHYDRKGKLLHTNYYKNDKPYGLFREYNEHGILLSEVMYKGGLRQGKQVSYHENGKTESIKTFDNDVPVGEEMQYFSTGQKQHEATFNSQGKKVGKETIYSPHTGTPREINDYDSNGVKHTTSFNEYSGSKTRMTKYEKEVEVESTIYDTAGNVLWINRFVNGNPIGVSRNYVWGKLDNQMYLDEAGNGYKFYYHEFNGNLIKAVYFLQNKIVSEAEFLYKFDIKDGLLVKK